MKSKTIDNVLKAISTESTKVELNIDKYIVRQAEFSKRIHEAWLLEETNDYCESYSLSHKDIKRLENLTYSYVYSANLKSASALSHISLPEYEVIRSSRDWTLDQT